jgi:hypothetical protein
MIKGIRDVAGAQVRVRDDNEAVISILCNNIDEPCDFCGGYGK